MRRATGSLADADEASESFAVDDGESGMAGPASSSGSGSGGHTGRNSQDHRGRRKRGAGGGGGSGGAAQRAVKRREHWANQLCTPEWMLTVPTDLNGAGSPVGAGELTRVYLLVCAQAWLIIDP